LEPGLRILYPIVDVIKYVHTLKEIVIEVPSQSGITRDNVTMNLDAVIYIKIDNPYKASYGVEDPEYAVTQLAQTTMRSELGRLSLDEARNALVLWQGMCLFYGRGCACFVAGDVLVLWQGMCLFYGRGLLFCCSPRSLQIPSLCSWV
jgi:hypothetical protein